MAVLLAVVATAATAGCGSASGGSGADQGVDPRALGTTARPVVQVRDRSTLVAAEHVLLADCMRAAGFTWHPATIEEVQWESRTEPWPYGFRSRADVARALRREQVALLEAPSIHKNDRYKQSLPRERLAEYQRAAYGPPGREHMAEFTMPDGERRGVSTKGCRGRATKALYGDVASWERLMATAAWVAIKVREETFASTAYESALELYRGCASERSVGGDNPYASAWAVRSAPADREEALIDAIWECQRESRLLEVADEVEQRVALQVTDEHEREILAYRERSMNALEKANHVLAGDR